MGRLIGWPSVRRARVYRHHCGAATARPWRVRPQAWQQGPAMAAAARPPENKAPQSMSTDAHGSGPSSLFHLIVCRLRLSHRPGGWPHFRRRVWPRSAPIRAIQFLGAREQRGAVVVLPRRLAKQRPFGLELSAIAASKSRVNNQPDRRPLSGQLIGHKTARPRRLGPLCLARTSLARVSATDSLAGTPTHERRHTSERRSAHQAAL